MSKIAQIFHGWFEKQKYAGEAKHIKLGRLGEDLAVKALVDGGYKIKERNAKISKREVDIIATFGELLVFVEVKARSDHSFGKPLLAVDKKQRKRLRQAADIYLLKKRFRDVSVRFDVVTVDFTNSKEPKIEIIKNAF